MLVFHFTVTRLKTRFTHHFTIKMKAIKSFLIFDTRRLVLPYAEANECKHTIYLFR